MSKRDNKEKGRLNKFNKILTLCLVGRFNDEVWMNPQGSHISAS